MKKQIITGALFIGVGIMTGSLAWQGTGTGVEKISVSGNTIQERSLSPSQKEADNLSLYALSAVLMDGDSGRVLYEKEADVFRPMASTTKIMTCILALENGVESDICKVSKNAAAQPKVHLGAGEGAEFYLKDLLYSLMLESHNDSAVVIAEQVAGSVEAFTEMMNQKARDIGCKNTYFLTPNGLDATVTTPDGTQYVHGTTAEDLAKILRYCITESPVREEFLNITQTQNYSFTDVSKKRSYSCVNHNALLTMMEGALTGKTGFTGGAGYSYVGAIEDDRRTYIIALLGSGWPPHKTYKWNDARTLFSYGKERFEYRDVYEEITLPTLLVSNGVSSQPVKEMENPVEDAPIYVELTLGLQEEEKNLTLLLSEEEGIETKIQIPKSLPAPIGAGDVVGNIVYYLEDQIIKTYPVYAASSVKEKDIPYIMQQIWYLFFLPG